MCDATQLVTNPHVTVSAFWSAQADLWLDRVISDPDRTQVDAWLARFHYCQDEARAAADAATRWQDLPQCA
jgi:hypothetical protein